MTEIVHSVRNIHRKERRDHKDQFLNAWLFDFVIKYVEPC
jgi:hypothetical protein